jgi:hypothetical protein
MRTMKKKIDILREITVLVSGMNGLWRNPHPEAKLVHSRDGRKKGRVIDGEKACTLDGCPGVRIAVRWFDTLRITWPCSCGMMLRPDGQWQII